MATWVDEGAADGFNIMPAWFPGGFDDFAEHVVPLLQARGRARTEYQGTTLREHLGLPLPV
jgi:alkanesulfonate monooxygenase SsuD/methylene tetrahydromethanopterin reductase-like flavin-dependent oxidoreductase (luciferase family)